MMEERKMEMIQMIIKVLNKILNHVYSVWMHYIYVIIYKNVLGVCIECGVCLLFLVSKYLSDNVGYTLHTYGGLKW